MEEYNACHVVEPAPFEISLSEALDPLFIRTKLTSVPHVAGAVTADKFEAIQAYLMVCRSREEVSMLKEDSSNVVSYYKNKLEVVQHAITSMTNPDPFSRGSISLLCSFEKKLAHLLDEASLTLQKMTSQGCDDFLLDDGDDGDGYSSDISCDDDGEHD